MTLRAGTWKINGNSAEGGLVITSVGSDGKLSGTVYGNQIEGFWNEGAQKVTFLRLPSGTSSINAIH